MTVTGSFYIKHKTMEPTIILQGISLNQFMQQLQELITGKIIEEMDRRNAEPPASYITRKEVVELLRITMPTLHSWTKEGIIPSYQIGSRVLFKKDEVLKAISARKNRR